VALARAAFSSLASRLEKMAPKMATPKDPPIDRKNVAPEVDQAETETEHEEIEAHGERGGVLVHP
jgi:hypothetical protein